MDRPSLARLGLVWAPDWGKEIILSTQGEMDFRPRVNKFNTSAKIHPAPPCTSLVLINDDDF